MTGNITELNSDNFDDFVKGGVTVVDFWAPWCGPCKVMGPVFDEASADLKGKVKFGKVNVDDNQELAQRFSVMSIPTMIFFKDGEQEDRAVGVLQKEELVSKSEAIN